MKKFHRFIIVDDDPTSNLICDFNIKRFDPTACVKSFLEPEEALEFIKQSYNKDEEDTLQTLLLLDVNMPSMTGFDFLKRFDTFSANVKAAFCIYMLTSSIEDFSEKAEGFPTVTGFLSKPLKISHLEEILINC